MIDTRGKVVKSKTTNIRPEVVKFYSEFSDSDRLPPEVYLVGEDVLDEMTFGEASEYLDWLECHGEEPKEIIMMEDGKVIVRECPVNSASY